MSYRPFRAPYKRFFLLRAVKSQAAIVVGYVFTFLNIRGALNWAPSPNKCGRQLRHLIKTSQLAAHIQRIEKDEKGGSSASGEPWFTEAAEEVSSSMHESCNHTKWIFERWLGMHDHVAIEMPLENCILLATFMQIIVILSSKLHKA
ncbi:hypothetical protein GOP47_0022387 [Adiantum capillus-veneris]|uniref:Uncharacterized protein n=1 Tax=Adiantum capillus-veneris TaxID=13818 RepID=A0A9D4U6E6_ADICA|nr:hypothetical protein GOP47_0022387 [Adiantum capillus-veneris]